MKAVIDTNCLLESINRKQSAYQLFLAFQDFKFIWIISNEILQEYDEILSNFYSIETSEYVLNRLLASENIEFHDPFFKWNLILNDISDNKFVDLAITSNADYLVTNDKDFNVIKNLDFPKVNIISLEQFIAII